jgi:hypothetical protein
MVTLSFLDFGSEKHARKASDLAGAIADRELRQVTLKWRSYPLCYAAVASSDKGTREKA